MKNGSVFRLNIPTRNIYAVADPAFAREILYDSEKFIKGSSLNNFRDNIFYPEGLIFMERGERWQKLHEFFLSGPLNPREFPMRYAKILRRVHSWLF